MEVRMIDSSFQPSRFRTTGKEVRMSKKLLLRAAVLALILSVGLPALAAEGRIPIYQYPTVITQPGKYIVTRNIDGMGGPQPIIDVQVGNVDIDLNGFSLYSWGAPAPIIYTFGGVPLTIRNGTIMGGTNGIEVWTGADELPSYKVVIEDVNIMNSETYGIFLVGISDFALRRNNVAFTGDVAIMIDGSNAMGWRVMGTIEHNRIVECHGGITVRYGSSVATLNNRLEEITNIAPPPAMGAIIYDYSEGGLISENTIEDMHGDGGAIYLGDSSGCKIYNNVVRRGGDNGGAAGIWLAGFSDDNLVLNNVVSQSWTDGVFVEGSRNHIDRNVMNNNGVSGQGHGLHLSAIWAGDYNTFGRNTARGNPGGPCAFAGGLYPPTTDFCDEGLINSSFNDNYMPNMF
jgi:parallel beta-helix repeat protein